MDKILAVSIVLLLSGAFLFSGSVSTVKTGLEVESWPAISARIVSVDILQMGAGPESGDEPKYFPSVHYTYMVEGVKYDGNMLYSYDYITSNKEELEEILKPYKKRQIVDIFYDPDNPDSSVILKGVKESEEASVFNVGSVLMVIGGLLFFYRSMKTGIF